MQIPDKFHSCYFSESVISFILLFIFCIPLYYSIKQSHDNNISNGEQKTERIAEYLFIKEKQEFNLNNWSVADNTYTGPFLFYKYKLKEKNQALSVIKSTAIKAQTKVIASNDSIKNYIKTNFNYAVVDTFYEVVAFDIKNFK